MVDTADPGHRMLAKVSPPSHYWAPVLNRETTVRSSNKLNTYHMAGTVLAARATSENKNNNIRSQALIVWYEYLLQHCIAVKCGYFHSSVPPHTSRSL